LEEGGPMSNTGAPIYVVDDDVSVREGVESLIRSAGLRVETFASAQEFLARPQSEAPSCLVLDVEMPGLSGLDLQEQLTKTDAQIPIIFLTGHGNIPMTVRAIKAGALEFLTKPFKDEDLLDAIQQAIDRYQTPPQCRNLAKHSFKGIIGTSAALKAALQQVERVAPTESTVLIFGETGTGKELIAHTIHNLSSRSGRAFVPVNCAAIPLDLLESELFGHEKGAFTGAIAQKVGRFDLADKGTLFLDEVGDIPAALQPKLLRVLQEQEFEPLGSTRTHKVDVRLVAATHRDLSDMVKRSEFRSDLYYRLNVFPIEVPPLRKRKEDISMLIECFVKRYAEKVGKQIRKIDKNTLELCQAYLWPGNIRELQNIVERSVILCSGDSFRIEKAWLESCQPPRQELSGPLPETLLNQEKEMIETALTESKGKVAGPEGAAAKLGIPRTTLDSKIKQLKIRKRRFVPEQE
jgi:DNA-binding NtrC family response regulator